MKKHLSIFLGTFVFISGCLNFENPTPIPSDNELIKIYNDNKEVFNQLATMICEDNYLVVSYEPQWSSPENIPQEKKKQYYELFKVINVQQIRRYKDGEVTFMVWATGNVSGGRDKGYVFRPNDHVFPRQVKESLDDIPLTSEFHYKMKITDDWYLYYDHDL